MNRDEIDHEFTRNVTCPWCGHEDRDSWERHMNDGDCEEDECGECGKPFVVSCHVTVEFSTGKDHARVKTDNTEAAGEVS